MWRRHLFLTPALAAAGSYEAALEAWRREQEAALRRDDGWLTVAGLFWLEEGVNHIEALPGAAITLRRGGRVTIASAQPLTVNGKPVIEAALQPNQDSITVGNRTLFVIARGGRYAIRMRDTESPYRRNFKGRRWYPANAALRVEARWIAYAVPVTRNVPSVGGITQQLAAPGEAEFTIDGRTLRLEPVTDPDGLMFVFKDLTAGKSTYGAGRFLDTPLPTSGRLVLDFNRAYNPPCAFTPHATCPLPLRRNHLPVAIPAGELDYHFE